MYRFVIVLSNKGYWNPRGWIRRGSILILHFWRKLCSHPLPSLRIFTRAQCSPLSALINCSSYPTASLITRRTNPSNIPTLLGSNSLLETLPCLSSNLVPFSSLLLEEIKRYSRLFTRLLRNNQEFFLFVKKIRVIRSLETHVRIIWRFKLNK